VLAVSLKKLKEKKAELLLGVAPQAAE